MLSETKYFDMVTVKDIAVRAQVKRQTFYYYFSDKYQCLSFYLAQWGQQLAAESKGPLKAYLLLLAETIYQYKESITHILISERGYLLFSAFIDPAIKHFLVKQGEPINQASTFLPLGSRVCSLVGSRPA